METQEKIRIHDKGVDSPISAIGEFQLSYRYGNITVPHLPSTEPLRAECEHFLHCIVTGEAPLTDGQQGLQVVRVLEATTASLRQGGSVCRVDADLALVDGSPTAVGVAWHSTNELLLQEPLRNGGGSAGLEPAINTHTS